MSYTNSIAAGAPNVRKPPAAAGIVANIIYAKSMLTSRILVPMSEVGKNIKSLLEREIRTNIEGKCIAEGFIRPGSVVIKSYSAGIVKNENVEFTVVYECDICHPVEGMLIECTVKTITKAGIHAKVDDRVNEIEPITVFIARDHHFSNKYFSTIKEGEKITARVIGIRYELNDKCIYTIAELVRPKTIENAARGGKADGFSDHDDDEEDDDDDETDN